MVVYASTHNECSNFVTFSVPYEAPTDGLYWTSDCGTASFGLFLTKSGRSFRLTDHETGFSIFFEVDGIRGRLVHLAPMMVEDVLVSAAMVKSKPDELNLTITLTNHGSVSRTTRVGVAGKIMNFSSSTVQYFRNQLSGRNLFSVGFGVDRISFHIFDGAMGAVTYWGDIYDALLSNLWSNGSVLSSFYTYGPLAVGYSYQNLSLAPNQTLCLSSLIRGRVIVELILTSIPSRPQSVPNARISGLVFDDMSTTCSIWSSVDGGPVVSQLTWIFSGELFTFTVDLRANGTSRFSFALSMTSELHPTGSISPSR
jgi:hypothetical protein